MYKYITVFLITLFLFSCSDSSTNPDGSSGSQRRPTTTISGYGFDGLIINGNVNVYDWSTGTKGELLGTTITDKNGKYGLDIISPDLPILIEIEEGFYIEESSGIKIQLDKSLGHRVTAIDYYVSGVPITISATYLSSIAHGYAEYLVSSEQLTPSNAIIEANNIVSALIGFDIVKTTPLDVSDPKNVATSLNIRDGLKYGFIPAGISKFTEQLHINAKREVHSLWPSVAFINIAYKDIVFDGVLNGVGVNGALTLGGYTFSEDTYREIISIKMLQFVISKQNKTNLTFDDVKPFASKLNKISGTLFNNTKAPDITLKKADITNIIPTNNITIGNSTSTSATVNDDFGIKKIEFFVDNNLVSTASDNTNPNYTIDITSVSEGPHSLNIIATNLMDNTTKILRNINVVYDVPTISGFFPADGSIVTNSYLSKASIADTYGLQNVQMYLDDVLLNNATNIMASPEYNIDILSINEGAHTVKLTATNTLGKITSIINKFTVTFSSPNISSFLPALDTQLSGNINAKITVSDNYGISKVEYFMDNKLIVGTVGPAPDYMQKISTPFFTNGAHTIEARVTNLVGKITSSSANAVVITNGNPSAKQIIYKPVMVAGGWSGLDMCENVPVEITDTNNVGIASVEATWYTNYTVSFNLKYNGTFSASLTPTSNVGNVYLYHLTLNPQPIDANDYYYPWNAPFSRVGDRFSYGFFKLIITDNANKSTTFKGYSFRNAGGDPIAYCGYY